MPSIAATVPRATFDALDAQADKLGLTRGGLVRLLVDAYLASPVQRHLMKRRVEAGNLPVRQKPQRRATYVKVHS